MHRLTWLPFLLLVSGILLLLLASIWSSCIDRRDYWTPRNAQASAEAGGKFHAAAHEMAHHQAEGNEEEFRETFDKTRKEYQHQQRAFEEAKDRYERPIRVLRYLGIGCLVLGLFGYLIQRSSQG